MRAGGGGGDSPGFTNRRLAASISQLTSVICKMTDITSVIRFSNILFYHFSFVSNSVTGRKKARARLAESGVGGKPCLAGFASIVFAFVNSVVLLA